MNLIFRKITFLFVLISIIPSQGFSLEKQNHSSPPIKGMALGLYSKDPNYDYSKDLRELKSLGVNSISLMVNWYQRDIHANEIHRNPENGSEHSTISDKKLVEVIQHAHRLNMKVLLFPFLRFEYRGPKEWRGVLKPENFATWTQNYEQFILHYANLARIHRVEILSVGSELGSLEQKTDFWKSLIQKVKQVYSGKLIYSSNWDHYTYPTFWQHLDYIGMNSYYTLSNSNQPSLAELTQSWRQIKNKLLTFQAKFSQKLVFTELGYPSLDGTNQRPWNYLIQNKADVEEQALCYQAFVDVWNDTPELAGVYWWVWFGEGGATDKSYTPRGKPAMQVMREWYGGTLGGGTGRKIHLVNPQSRGK